MNSWIEQLSLGAGVAIIRLRSLGDSVLTTPAVHLLKQARPDLRVAIVSERRFAEVWDGNPDVDAVLEPCVGAIRGFAPELCINLHGGPRSARLTLFSGARWRAGFAHFGYRRVYNVLIPRAQEVLGIDRTVHTAEHAASAMFYLGVPCGEVPRARLYTDRERPRVAGAGPYAVLHPMASEASKTWPAQSFLAIARHLKREMEIQPVFLAGPGEDATPFQAWPVLAGASLAEAKALLQGAALFIGNDSGPAHVAAAFGVPVVVIFGASDSVVWAPWKTEAQVLAADGAITHVSEQMVMRAVDQLGVHA